MDEVKDEFWMKKPTVKMICQRCGIIVEVPTWKSGSSEWWGTYGICAQTKSTHQFIYILPGMVY